MAVNKRIEQLLTFLKESPDDTFLHYALAMEYVGLQEDALARDIFLRLISNDELYSPAYYHLGKVYEREGSIEKAREIYEKGVDICRRNKEMKNLAEMQAALTNLLLDE